ncbi:probable disease resistance protein At5g43730 [Hevea brasiliensis]|nr:probable disease resistance protein At5g43730 [Hevea brasiliensis]
MGPGYSRIRARKMEFVIATASTVVGEIAKTLVAPVGRSIGYLIYYHCNIKNLEEELQKLVDKKITGVDSRVDDVKRNLQVVAGSVIHWQEEVDYIDQRGKEFLENVIKVNNLCFNGRCPDPTSRYCLSRKAKKMTEKVLALLEEAVNFGQIGYPGPPPNIGSTFITEGIKDFESRLSIMKGVWEALKDDNRSMTGICGMGGVGEKDTMASRLNGVQ